MVDDYDVNKKNRKISQTLLWVFLGMAIACSLFGGFLYFNVRERVIASIPVTLLFNNAVDKSPIFGVQIEWIQELDNPEGESIYIAETNGKLICTYSYDDAGTLEYYTEYKYDRNGNLISSI